MKKGRIAQIIGAVIDGGFGDDSRRKNFGAYGDINFLFYRLLL